jgi:hypothetical protein
MTRIYICLLILVVTSSGCVMLAAGAVGYGVTKMVSKSKPRVPHLTEMQRRNLEVKELEGEREDVLRAAVTVLQDRGFIIKTSDYLAGIIAAYVQKPQYFEVGATIEQFAEKRMKMRITITDKDGPVEDPKVFTKIFSDIQAEIFLRQNIRK